MPSGVDNQMSCTCPSGRHGAPEARAPHRVMVAAQLHAQKRAPDVERIVRLTVLGRTAPKQRSSID